MNVKRNSILLVFLIILIPTELFSQDLIRTGYDVYHNIQLLDKAKSPDDAMNVAMVLGYLDGYISGLLLMQDALFNSMFPKKILSEKEREKYAKEMNFNRLNIPHDELHIGQLILIYKNWAEKHPNDLNQSARLCFFYSLIDAYGWK